MQPDTFRTLAEYIHELRRRNRNNYGTSEQPCFDTTTEDDSNWDQRNWSGDGRRDQNKSR